MHADLRMVSHESALCTIGCEYISLESFVSHSHGEGFCPSGVPLSTWLSLCQELSRRDMPAVLICGALRRCLLGTARMLLISRQVHRGRQLAQRVGELLIRALTE